MASKFYAIRKGFDKIKGIEVNNLIVTSWSECEKYVKGAKNAEFKSFSSTEQCKEYFGFNVDRKASNLSEDNILKIYVDGSYNQSTDEFAYGYVAIHNNIIVNVDNGKQKSDSYHNTRQVAGELMATIKGIEYAESIGFKNVRIYHDYIGIRNHATGEWKRDKQSSIDYYNKIQSLIKNGFNISFEKVDAHTNVLMNELADELCKIKLDIPSDKSVDKYTKVNKIFVSNQMLKDKLSDLVSNSNNIEVTESKIKTIEPKSEYVKELFTVDELLSIYIKDLSTKQKEQVVSFIKKNLL